MTDAMLDAELLELRSEIDRATPGPEFNERVKAHIARTRVRRPARSIATAALAASVCWSALSFLTRDSSVVPNQAVAAAPRVPLTSALNSQQAPTATPRVAKTSPWLATAVPIPRRHQVVVDVAEAMALDRWLSHLRGQREPETVVTFVPPIAPIEIPLIQIPPIEIHQPGGERKP